MKQQKGKSFYLKFDRDWWKKGQIIYGEGKKRLEVIKVYRYTKWRRFLTWLGFKVRMMEVKVIPKEESL